MSSLTFVQELRPQRFVFNQERGLQQLLGTYPCIFNPFTPHPLPDKNSRRLARFRRRIEAGLRFQRKEGMVLNFLTLAVKHDPQTGILAVGLKRSVNRFIQELRRKSRGRIEYLRVVEGTTTGARNHVHLIVASEKTLPPEHDLKDLWAHVTYGTSFEVKNRTEVDDEAGVVRYLSKALQSYLSKGLDGQSFPEGSNASEASSATGGLDSRCQTATVSDYVSTSRGWLPVGAETEWKRLFRENAYIWLCDRGFYHTELGQTGVKWLAWLDRQAWGAR